MRKLFLALLLLAQIVLFAAGTGNPVKVTDDPAPPPPCWPCPPDGG